MNPNDKAYIKSTGEILDIKSTYVTYNVKVTYPIKDNDIKVNEILSRYKIPFREEITSSIDDISVEEFPDIHVDNPNRVMVYLLSDGESYPETELIIGMDNIRNLNINKILK